VTIDLRAARACAWCGSPLDPDAPGRRLYCSVACRQDRGHYVEAEPGLRARLAELVAAASNYRGKVPTFIVNELHDLRRALVTPLDGSI
jgi:hypothetical protein